MRGRHLRGTPRGFGWTPKRGGGLTALGSLGTCRYGHVDRLGADKDAVETRFAILQQHLHDLVRMRTDFVGRIAVAMRPGPIRNPPTKTPGVGVSFR
jgi:hypothetical protein